MFKYSSLDTKKSDIKACAKTLDFTEDDIRQAFQEMTEGESSFKIMNDIFLTTVRRRSSH
jgi:hypothetical protein